MQFMTESFRSDKVLNYEYYITTHFKCCVINRSDNRANFCFQMVLSVARILKGKIKRVEKE